MYRLDLETAIHTIQELSQQPFPQPTCPVSQIPDKIASAFQGVVLSADEKKLVDVLGAMLDWLVDSQEKQRQNDFYFWKEFYAKGITQTNLRERIAYLDGKIEIFEEEIGYWQERLKEEEDNLEFYHELLPS
jgi:hypothetical protein